MAITASRNSPYCLSAYPLISYLAGATSASIFPSTPAACALRSSSVCDTASSVSSSNRSSKRSFADPAILPGQQRQHLPAFRRIEQLSGALLELRVRKPGQRPRGQVLLEATVPESDLSAAQRDDAAVDLSLLQEMAGRHRAIDPRRQEPRRVIDRRSGASARPSIPACRAQGGRTGSRSSSLGIPGACPPPVRPASPESVRTIARAARGGDTPQVQHRQRGQHQRISSQDADGGNVHRR